MNTSIDILPEHKEAFNKIVTHPLQSYEWGEFRKKTGVKVIRRGLFRNKEIIDGFTLTLHKIPRTKFYIGYLPKGNLPTPQLLDELKRIGREENCIFIQLEPKVRNNQSSVISYKSLRPAAHPLFTKYTFILDLTKSEDELLSAMHSKTRYNIRVAEKHKVKVVEDNSKDSFEHYLKLMMATTFRQGFYAHTPAYHRKLWELLANQTENRKQKTDLSYHLLNAIYVPPATRHPLTLASWVILVFKDTMYYPYGASSRLYRETMASNLIMWGAIKFGKKLGLADFDMWGALGRAPDKKDPWYGFHRFKEGYGGELVEFVGSYDLVIKPAFYEIYKIADKFRWTLLKIRSLIR